MDFLERDLEDIIYHTDQAKIRSKGLSCYQYNFVLRQYALADYGIADLITVRTCHAYPDTGCNRNILITVYELKQNKIDVGVMLQAAKYIKALQCIVALISEQRDLSRTMFTYEIVLVGRTVTLSGDFCYLPDIFDNLSIYTYSYSADGIQFKEEREYHLPDCNVKAKANEIADAFLANLKSRIASRKPVEKSTQPNPF